MNVASLSNRNSVKKPMFYMLTAVVVFVAILGGVKYYQISQAMAANAHQGPPPQAVTTAKVAESVWHPAIEVVGSLAPSQGVTLSSELEGTVVGIGFESGAAVKKGDLLVQMDTSIEDAQLQSANARLELARINLKRAQGLFNQSATSEASLNNAVSEAKAAEGDVKAIEAVIAKKTITAPFDGRAGIRMVNVGQYLQKGDKIVPLHQLNPMFLDFSVPQQNLSAIKVGQEVKFFVDVFPGEEFRGQVTAIDTEIDELTRNVHVQATVTNPDERLKPGMFAQVRLLLGQDQKVMAIPATSINYAPYGNSVYVVEKIKGPDGSEYDGVRQQFVEIGGTKGDLVSITKGIKVGDKVVTSGVFKLRPGIPVIINNSILPGSDPAPQPEDT